MRFTLAGYPVLFGVARPIRLSSRPDGLSEVLESVSPHVRLALVEGLPVECRLNHGVVVASTADGTLAITTDSIGIRVTVTPRDELAARVWSAQPLGGSFGWHQQDGARYRWHIRDGQPHLREILAARIHELTITPAPAFKGTWITPIGPEIAGKWARLAQYRGVGPCIDPLPPADATLTLTRRPGDWVGALGDAIEDRLLQKLSGVETDIRREFKAVQRLIAAHRGPVRNVDVIYERSIASVLAVQRRREAQMQMRNPPVPAGAERAPAPKVRPAGGPLAVEVGGRFRADHRSSTTTKKETLPMSHNLARREFLGIGELGPAETAKRLKKFHEELLRRKPDAATNFSITYRPFVDSRGVWHPGAQVQRRSVR